jgi:hypothetical protein
MQYKTLHLLRICKLFDALRLASNDSDLNAGSTIYETSSIESRKLVIPENDGKSLTSLYRFNY